ncbi:MAG: 6-phosphogluconolactonase, partial [Deltaproteobacteria bacterium]|nr:6-phosphogluconolactonase [Deltaproteobacteria bacterium]
LMVRTALLDVMDEARVHRIQGELAPAVAADTYEHELVDALGVPPQLDLVLLGLGTDGHTASLFPASPALAQTERWVVANPSPTGDARITLTAKTIQTARHIRFFVLGASKAAVLAEVLEAAPDPDRLPAQMITSSTTDVGWFVDGAAAALLRRAS